jgi:hypothetical protein
MHGIDGVFLALKPVAWDFRKNDLAETVLPGERFPIRDERSRIRAQISPDQAGPHSDRIRLDTHFIFEARFGSGDIVIGLLDAAPGFIESPTVIVAAQATLFDESVGQVGSTVSALPVDKPERPLQVLE